MDPQKLEKIGELPLLAGPESLALAPDVAWVTSKRDNTFRGELRDELPLNDDNDRLGPSMVSSKPAAATGVSTGTKRVFLSR